jgi:hypothetical protein
LFNCFKVVVKGQSFELQVGYFVELDRIFGHEALIRFLFVDDA